MCACLYACMRIEVCMRRAWVGDLTCAHVGHLFCGEHGERQLGDGPGQLQAAGDGAFLQLLVADAVHVLDRLAQQRKQQVREHGLPMKHSTYIHYSSAP